MLTIDVLALLSVAGAVQLFLMAAAFSTSHSLPQRVFAAFAFTTGIIIAGSVAMETPVIASAPHLARIHIPFNYLIAPLFYLFVRASLTGNVGRRVWQHAIPSVLCAAWLIRFYALPAITKLAFIQHPSREPMVHLVLLIIQAGVYVAMTFRLLARRDRVERVLWIATWGVTAMWFAAVARLAGGFSPRLIPAALAIAALAIGGALLRGRVAPRKYAGSRLDAAVSQAHLRKLVASFESEKLFLDPALSLDTLSRRLAIPSKYLSQIVNEQLGHNFNDWLNGWRVGEAKRRLTDTRFRHLSIIAIGEASGFPSKSTFNAAFRRETSMTPSEYRRRRPD
jgi:AraC-like DNA-binding protein